MKSSLIPLTLLLLLCIFSSTTFSADPPVNVKPDHARSMKLGTALFTKSVKSILVKQCLDCHGGKSTKAEFDLSTRKALLESGYVEAGNSKESALMGLLDHSEEPHMPHKARKLSDSTIMQIAQWIDFGAPYDQPLAKKKEKTEEHNPEVVTQKDRQFWSFQPLTVVTPPTVKDTSWVKTPVDRFVLAKLEQQKIHPNSTASKRLLIRRVYYDLTGLPPTPKQVEAFVNNKDSGAYEKLIDQLLSSKSYGERWARHWMDVARFAESHGYEQDYNRPNAYHYRDFLIKALNSDMPYDQFIRWQIAGDELAPKSPLAMAATGFLGAGVFPTQLTETEFESARYDELDDMVSTVGSGMLGLSVGCARCHDHKFDPIPARDYYRMLATFSSTIRTEVEYDPEKQLFQSLGQPPKKKKNKDGKTVITQKKKPNLIKMQVTTEGFKPMKHHADGRGYPHFYPKVYYLSRGDVTQKKEEVQPGFLQVVSRSGSKTEEWKVAIPDNWKRTSYRRSNLANWLTDTKNGAGHLLARVIVNRVWQHHFGRGIVATPNDFGFQGDRPTHPELLDWLAVDLIQHGWKLKRLHKLILTSHVYMQSSQFDESRAKVDRENQFHWRRTPRRLEGEAIRDAMLAVSGRLDHTMYGPGTLNENMKRRSIYFFIKRSKLIPTMMLFDWPEHLSSIGRRSNTTIAPQALLFMNNPAARDYAKGFAERISKTKKSDAVTQGYQMAFGRSPTEQEKKLATAFIINQTKTYQQTKSKNAQQLALADFCQSLLSANEFVYVD